MTEKLSSRERAELVEYFEMGFHGRKLGQVLARVFHVSRSTIDEVRRTGPGTDLQIAELGGPDLLELLKLRTRVNEARLNMKYREYWVRLRRIESVLWDAIIQESGFPLRTYREVLDAGPSPESGGYGRLLKIIFTPYHTAREKFQQELLAVHAEHPSITADELVFEVTRRLFCLLKSGSYAVMENIDGEARHALGYLLTTLPRRMEAVIKLHFGLGYDEKHSLEEIAARYGVTRERIRQIEAKAIRILRHPSRSRHLERFINWEQRFLRLEKDYREEMGRRSREIGKLRDLLHLKGQEVAEDVVGEGE